MCVWDTLFVPTHLDTYLSIDMNHSRKKKRQSLSRPGGRNSHHILFVKYDPINDTISGVGKDTIFGEKSDDFFKCGGGGFWQEMGVFMRSVKMIDYCFVGNRVESDHDTDRILVKNRT